MLLAELGFEDVGVGGFTGGFALLGDVDEAVGFIEGALGYGDFALARGGTVVEVDDGEDEAAAGDFEFCLGFKRVGVSESDGAGLGEAYGFVDEALAVVLVDGVVGDEDGEGLRDALLIELAAGGAEGGVRVVGLGEEVLVVEGGAG